MTHSFTTIAEVLVRLTTPRHERFSQARSFDVIYGGSECNVAVALSCFGARTSLVSRVPDNDIGQACVNSIRQYGVDTSHVLRSGPRIGLYYLEMGAAMRPSKVVYDRAGSAMSQIAPGMVDWDSALGGRDWFHFSGITAAISESAAATVAEGCRAAKAAGLTVSADFNYRSALWTPAEAARVLDPLMEHVDVAIGSARDPILGAMVGVDGNVLPRERGPDAYAPLIEAAVARYGFSNVALSVRDIHSSDRNDWMGVYWDGSGIAVSRTHDIDIVDRVGGGDGFTAGVIWAILEGYDRQATAGFATASGALAHTVHGDFSLVTEDEVHAAATGGGDVRR